MKKVITLFAAVLIMLLPCFTASAYPSSGSITVVMINKANKQPMSNQRVNAVKVAECSNTEADFTFSLDPAYGTGFDLETPETAQKLYSAVQKKGATGKSAVSDSEGTAVFEDCELGAYLIYSSEENFAPFLALLPMVTDDGINFNLTAEPKIDIPEETTKTPDTEKTTTPSEKTPIPPSKETETTTSKSSSSDKKKKLPQTGMLQLPVPILGFLGALMFSEGFVLYAKGKKEED